MNCDAPNYFVFQMKKESRFKFLSAHIKFTTFTVSKIAC